MNDGQGQNNHRNPWAAEAGPIEIINLSEDAEVYLSTSLDDRDGASSGGELVFSAESDNLVVDPLVRRFQESQARRKDTAEPTLDSNDVTRALRADSVRQSLISRQRKLLGR